MRKLALLLCIVSNMFQAAPQVTGTLQTHKAMEKVVSDVKRKVPKMTNDTAITDIGTLTLADGEVRQFYSERGFAGDQINKIYQLSLIELRKDSPNGDIDRAVFKQNTEDFGLITIDSAPEGADVWIDNLKWDEPTNTQAFTHSGTRPIRLHKDGYEDVRDTVVVKAGHSVDFHRTLAKKTP